MKFKYRLDGPAVQRSEMKPRMLPAELPNLLHWFDTHPDQTFSFGTGSDGFGSGFGGSDGFGSGWWLQGKPRFQGPPNPGSRGTQVPLTDRHPGHTPRFQGHPGTPIPVSQRHSGTPSLRDTQGPPLRSAQSQERPRLSGGLGLRVKYTSAA